MDVFSQDTLGLLARIVLSLTPVLVFLIALVFLDSFKLVRPDAVVRSILVGCIAAVASLILNMATVATIPMQGTTFTRYVAPVIEECCKFAFLAWLVGGGRVGFIVDTAVHGFAIGAGFALVENIYYLQTIHSSNLLLWLVRGFGTAVMHGGTMIIAGVIAKTIYDRKQKIRVSVFLPGLLVAIVVHSLFNHFVLGPLMSTAVLLIALPILVFVVFQRSEAATMQWLGTGMDSDLEVIELISTGTISSSSIGRYLESLRDRFVPTVVADMLCLLQIQAELSIRAKSLLLLKKHGVNPPPDPSLKAILDEMSYLESSIGRTGKLAMAPVLHLGHRELWQIRLLAEGQ
jgi:RsiW-degrading membrane proteinase PrsW (M82 family)